MCKTMLVVVLYDKTYKDSLTLNSLMNKSFSEVDLMIVNHGPNPLKFDKDFIHTLGFFVGNVVLKEYLDGRLLSGICNTIINEHDEYERFIFFDDESDVGKKFIKNLDLYFKNHIDLQIPNIRGRSDRKIHYPVIAESTLRNDEGTEVNSTNRVRSLGTGLAIYRSLITKFKAENKEVFDSNFTLRDLDCGFFIHLDATYLTSGITIQIVNTIVHSLLRTDSPSNKFRIMDRIRERLI
ncbi:MAG: hypothetical protein QM578_24240 [Pantoea sp.]|uniref:hypothetical protein n=1 Tax=Pantoea sp. TaxID=69393 RepID=UPI0039E62DA1